MCDGGMSLYMCARGGGRVCVSVWGGMRVGEGVRVGRMLCVYVW